MPATQIAAFDAWFRDAETHEGRWGLDEIVYRTPEGRLLEVAHDLTALRKARDATAWKALWDGRWSPRAHALASGVWDKREVVLPRIPAEHIVSLGEGRSDLLSLGAYARGLGLDPERTWLKQCGNGHTGSFKDLGMTVLVSQVNHLVRSGRQPGIVGVACASTGDTSAALAAYCAAAGLPAVVLIPRDKVSPAQLVQPMANGALTLALDTDFDGCMRLVQELTADRKLYLANSMNSLRIEGQKTVAYEVAQQLGWQVPDWIFISGGNLGNTSALYKGFEEMQALGIVERIPTIVCCQAAAADPLYRYYASGWRDYTPQQARPTAANAIRIGDPVSLPKAVAGLRRHGGHAAIASEQQLADAMARADAAGCFTCPHTGVALAGLEQFAAAGRIPRGASVVVISTAHGLKFANVKADYHADRLDEVKAGLANPPVPLAANTTAVYDAVQRHFAPRS
jgi:threonine synthase